MDTTADAMTEERSSKSAKVGLDKGHPGHVTIKSEPYDPSYDAFQAYSCQVQNDTDLPLLVPQTQTDCSIDFSSAVKQEWDRDVTINGVETSDNLCQKKQLKIEPDEELVVKADVEMTDVKDEVGCTADEETADVDKELHEFDDGSEPGEESSESGVPFPESASDQGQFRHKTMCNSESFHKCMHCQKLFDTEVVLNRHLYKVSARPDEPHSCPKCGEYVICRTHLWAHVLTHKGKTPYICKECGMVFKTDETMKKHMLHKHFKGVHTCEVCQTTFESMVDLVNHLLTHRGVSEQNKCLLCSETFEKKEDLFEHFLSHNEKSFICKVCMKAFDTKENLNTHSCDLQYCNLCLKTFNTKEELREHRSSHNVGEGLKVCLECGKTFVFKATLLKHMRNCHQDGPFPCEECNEVYDKRSELKTHLQSKHARKELYFCEDCNLEFSSCSDIIAHRKTHEYKCNICMKKYKSKYVLLKHIETWHKKSSSSSKLDADQKSHVYKYDRHMVTLKSVGMLPKEHCAECNLEFSSSSDPAAHLKTHSKKFQRNGVEPLQVHKNKASVCKLCLIAFDTEESLATHNCNLRQCSLCLMAFSSEQQLQEHVQFHDIREDRIFCLECGKTFKSKAKYQDHVRNFHKGGPFPCKECSQVFENKSELMSHVRSEHACRKYYCKECNVEFSSSQDMRAHQKMHVYSCSGCTKKYRYENVLLMHMETCLKKCCEGCGLDFSSSSELEAHLKSGLCDCSKSLPKSKVKQADCPKERCLECHLEFSSLSDLIAHQVSHVYNCERCTVVFRSKDQLLKHLEACPKLRCRECSLEFCSLSDLAAHEKTHIYKCDRCMLAFESREMLSKHVKVCVTEPCRCTECSLEFDSWADMLMHRRNSHIYKCDKCITSVNSKSEFKKHMVVVHGDAVYNCLMCGMGFKVMSDLVKHSLDVHNNSMPFKCEKCGKMFRTNKGLTLHLAGHCATAKRGPLLCQSCHLIFSTDEDYSGHMNAEHVVPCTLCDNRFRDTSELWQHYATKHGEGGEMVAETAKNLRNVAKEHIDQDQTQPIKEETKLDQEESIQFTSRVQTLDEMPFLERHHREGVNRNAFGTQNDTHARNVLRKSIKQYGRKANSAVRITTDSSNKKELADINGTPLTTCIWNNKNSFASKNIRQYGRKAKSNLVKPQVMKEQEDNANAIGAEALVVKREPRENTLEPAREKMPFKVVLKRKQHCNDTANGGIEKKLLVIVQPGEATSGGGEALMNKDEADAEIIVPT